MNPARGEPEAAGTRPGRQAQWTGAGVRREGPRRHSTEHTQAHGVEGERWHGFLQGGTARCQVTMFRIERTEKEGNAGKSEGRPSRTRVMALLPAG